MNARIERIWDALRSSLWIVPSGMTAGAALLALGCIRLDRFDGIRPEGWLAWLYSGGPEGARALLATVAGSMITVAGVTFSITIVALTLASTQFGPRLLRNFMRDRVNQVVLGTFIATFVYCMLVLRTVRDLEETSFVPHVAVTVGLALAIVSMGVLLYFIHHVSSSIQADSVIRAVSVETEGAIRRLYPEDLGEVGSPGADPAPEIFDHVTRDGAPLCAPRSGYVQAIDGDALMATACEHELVVRLRCRPGAYAIEGVIVAHVWPSQRLDPAVADRLLRSVMFGPRRTLIQDVGFGFSQLVEVAARALSPGINDPFTAVACIDRLAALLAVLGRRRLPSSLRADAAGSIRVITDAASFEHAADAAFDQIRQYGATHEPVLLRLVHALADLGQILVRTADRRAVRTHIERVGAAAERGLQDETARARLRRAVDEALAGLDQTGSTTGTCAER